MSTERKTNRGTPASYKLKSKARTTDDKKGSYSSHNDNEVIEISSDEEDAIPQTCCSPALDNHFLSDNIHDNPGAWPTHTGRSITSIGKQTTRISVKKKRGRRTIESSSSGSDEPSAKSHVVFQDPEIIELSDDSDSTSERPVTPKPKAKPTATTTQTQMQVSSEKPVSLYADDEESSNDDDAILTLDEPTSARKPIRLVTSLTYSPAASPRPDAPHNKSGVSSIRFGVSVGTVLHDTSTPSHKSPTKSKQPRTSKKSQEANEQARRESYAQKLFTELNEVVFKNGLPKETKLNWNKRLLTTAGRAKWHRSRDGVETTEIELAAKILDRDERIRNTLSHEMCHLACWVIDGEPKEGHGRLFKGWAVRVMKKRPEIEISTRHNYEISHPYEWKCEKCAKVYGRFSKSIRPDECVCGACKIGKLLPLFSVAQRAQPKTPKTSRMAAGNSQGSPCPIPRSQDDQTAPKHDIYTVHDSDSDTLISGTTDIDKLITALGSVSIIASETR